MKTTKAARQAKQDATQATATQEATANAVATPAPVQTEQSAQMVTVEVPKALTRSEQLAQKCVTLRAVHSSKTHDSLLSILYWMQEGNFQKNGKDWFGPQDESGRREAHVFSSDPEARKEQRDRFKQIQSEQMKLTRQLHSFLRENGIGEVSVRATGRVSPKSGLATVSETAAIKLRPAFASCKV